jgi:exopolysaccharide/PEP-CTERM locus tyrosine autokinase
LGKFFEAFERHDQEVDAKRLTRTLNRSDWYALLKYDRASGRLDLADKAIIRANSTAERLVRCGLIHSDGRLTPEGIKACDRFMSLGNASKAVSADGNGHRIPASRVHNGDGPALDKRSRDAGASPLPIASGARDRHSDPAAGFPAGRSIPAAPEPRCPVNAAPNAPDDPPNSGISPDLVVLHKPYGVEAEQFRKLRSAIMFPGTTAMPRLVLVTSTEPGEGKSFVAANLAATIAMNLNHHVLLVDCDLRRPSLHALFNLRPDPGLSDHLAARRDLAAVIQRVAQPRLSVVSAGRTPLNPAELLTSDRMARFLDEVKNRYQDRFVILDSPPPAVASELKILSGLVDGIVLVLKEAGPGREKVQDVVRQLDKQKILGMVGNFASKRGSDADYYDKQYRYYQHKKDKG